MVKSVQTKQLKVVVKIKKKAMKIVQVIKIAYVLKIMQVVKIAWALKFVQVMKIAHAFKCYIGQKNLIYHKSYE